MAWGIDQIDHGRSALQVSVPGRDGQTPRLFFGQPVCVNSRQCTHK